MRRRYQGTSCRKIGLRSRADGWIGGTLLLCRDGIRVGGAFVAAFGGVAAGLVVIAREPETVQRALSSVPVQAE